MPNIIPVSKDLRMQLTDCFENEPFEFEGKTYTLIEETDWVDGGKYQYQEIIFSTDNKFYSLSVTRSGSYFTDYEFDYEDKAEEVKKVTKTIETWEIVK